MKSSERKLSNTLGVIYDVTESYDVAFYVAGILIAMGGLVSCLIPVYQAQCGNSEKLAEEAWEEQKQQKQEELLTVKSRNTSAASSGFASRNYSRENST